LACFLVRTSNLTSQIENPETTGRTDQIYQQASYDHDKTRGSLDDQHRFPRAGDGNLHLLRNT